MTTSTPNLGDERNLEHHDTPDEELSHRQILTILTGLMLGMFLAALDQTIVATSIRTIADELKGLDHQAWATTAYLITSTIVTPLYGKLSDIYGRKRFFLTAITIFIIGSALCSFSNTMAQLSIYRAIQGLGAGGLFALALAIVGDIVAPRERAKYQGYFLAVFGTSSVLGPVVGGFLAGQSSILGVTGWRWVFLVNVPIGLVALLVVARTLHLRHTRLDHRIDYLGALTLALGLVPLLTVAEQGREWGWTSQNSLVCYAVGVVGLISFLIQEWRMKDEALLPLTLFANKTVGVSSLGSIIIGIGMFGGFVSIPLYLQIVKGASATEGGLQMVPMTLGIVLGSIISGQAISRTGRYKVFPIAGSALLAASLFVLHYLQADTPLWQAMVVMFFFGLGLGGCLQPLTLAVQNAVPPNQIGVATSSATFTRQIGGTIGTALFLSILFGTVGDKINADMKTSLATPEYQQALTHPINTASAEFAKQMVTSPPGADASSAVLSDSSVLNGLDPVLARPFITGFSNAMDLVFLVGACITVLAVFVLLLLPQVELRHGSAQNERDKSAPTAPKTDLTAGSATVVGALHQETNPVIASSDAVTEIPASAPPVTEVRHRDDRLRQVVAFARARPALTTGAALAALAIWWRRARIPKQ